MTTASLPATILPYMHLWYRSPERLLRLIQPFQHGQCQIYASSKEVYRGGVSYIQVVEYDKVHRVNIYFDWLFTRGLARHEFDETLENWKTVAPPPNGFDFIYIWYYPQRTRNRLKLKGWRESCRFYLPNDPTNISVDYEI